MPRNFRNPVSVKVDWYQDEYEVMFMSRITEEYNQAFTKWQRGWASSIEPEGATAEEKGDAAVNRQQIMIEMFDETAISMNFDAEDQQNWKAEVPSELKAKFINKLLATDKVTEERAKN